MDEAKIWGLSDSEVIGSGAMEFDNWTPGVSAKLTRYEGYKADALDCEKVGTPPVCTGNFFSYMHQPYIGGMLFKIYKTAQAAVFALQAGEIDVVSWSVPPEFVGELIRNPNVEITATAEKGFFYLSYNMRISPFGYPDNDPTKGDVGLWLRKAIAHVIDKKRIVTTLLQNFGVRGDQPVSPGFTKWYNASVTRYDYDLEKAKEILDDHYTESFQGGEGLGWAGGWRNLPTIGNQEIELLCPQADYDPIRAQACNMIAGDMR
jgi:ABC-type transport system substrate-binding protein